MRRHILLLSFIVLTLASCGKDSIAVKDNEVKVTLSAAPAPDAQSTDLIFTLTKGSADKPYTLSYKMDHDAAVTLSHKGSEAPSPVSFTFDIDRKATFTTASLTPGSSHFIDWSLRSQDGVLVTGNLDFKAGQSATDDGGGQGSQTGQYKVSFTENKDSTLVVMTVEGQGDKVSVDYKIDNNGALILSDATGSAFPSGKSVTLGKAVFTMPTLTEGEHRIWLSFTKEGEKEGHETVSTFRHTTSHMKRLWIEDARGAKLSTLNLWGGNDYDIRIKYFNFDGVTEDLTHKGWDSYSITYKVGSTAVTPFTTGGLVSLERTKLYDGSTTAAENYALHTVDWFPIGMMDEKGVVGSSYSKWASGNLIYTLTLKKSYFTATLTGSLQGTLGVTVAPANGKAPDGNGYYHVYSCESGLDGINAVVLSYPKAGASGVVRDTFAVRTGVTSASDVDVDFSTAKVVGGAQCTYRGTYPRVLTSKEFTSSAMKDRYTVKDTYSGRTISGVSLGKNSFDISILDPYVMSGTTLANRKFTVRQAVYCPVKQARVTYTHYSMYFNDPTYSTTIKSDIGRLGINDTKYETSKYLTLTFDSPGLSHDFSYEFTGLYLDSHTHNSGSTDYGLFYNYKENTGKLFSVDRMTVVKE